MSMTKADYDELVRLAGIHKEWIFGLDGNRAGGTPMRTALKWYLIVGATILFTLILMSSVTPAISDMALLLNVFWGWFGKLYTIESVILACGFIAVLDRGGARK